MNDQPLLTERRDRVLLITLNRPDARNAVNLAMAEAMAAALDELDGDDGLSVGVIAGEGKGFSSGMDLKAFATGERPWAADRGFAGIVQKPAAKPLVAAIEGFAVAGGLEIALACDLIVAAKGAKLGIPEVKRGLVAAAGALRQLPRRLPAAVAMELALTGETITAERSAELGLINRLAEPGKALEVALELAGRDRRKRPARDSGLQIDPQPPGVLGRRDLLGKAGRDRRPRVHLRGRDRGRHRLLGEARTELARPLAARALPCH